MATKRKTAGKVGFANPPKSARFQKGKSGNPKGRPKGSQNMATVLEKALNEKVTITEQGGRKTQISKAQAMAKQLANKAAQGDPRTMQQVLNATRYMETGASPGPAPTWTFTEDDEKVIDQVVQRILRSAKDEAP
jgi:hypothetical protein